MPEKLPGVQGTPLRRQDFTMPILTDDNQARCPRLKEVEYAHPLYGAIPQRKLVLCSEPHPHQMEVLFTWNEHKNYGRGGYDKAQVQVFSHYENIIPTEQEFEEAFARELERFQDLAEKAKRRSEPLLEFIQRHRSRPAPKPRREPSPLVKALKSMERDVPINVPPLQPKPVDYENPDHWREDPGDDTAARAADVKEAVAEALKKDNEPTGEKRPVPADDKNLPEVDGDIYPDEL